MKRYIKNFMMAMMVGATVFGSSCTDSFEEVNTDPDSPTDVPTTNLLAYSLYYTSYRLYDRWFAMDEPMTFCGYASKMTYIDESRYNFRTGVQDTNWEYLYRILNNLKDIEKRATFNETPNMLNVSKVMQVHLMQVATDRWRDVPYTDAAKMTDGVLQPKYDKQEDIYPGLLATLKEAADGFADGGSDDLGEGDLLFGGDIEKWRRYCNSMRLRLAMRISEVSPALAKETVEEVMGNPTKYPIMESNDDNAFFWWIGTDPNYYEPMADGYRTRKTEYCAADVIVDHMNTREDPRRSSYFQPTKESVEAGEPKYVGYSYSQAVQARQRSFISSRPEIYSRKGTGSYSFCDACAENAVSAIRQGTYSDIQNALFCLRHRIRQYSDTSCELVKQYYIKLLLFIMRRSEDRHGTAFSELSASFVEALGQACCLDDLTEILLEATDCFFRRYPSSENTRIVDKAIDYILRNYSDEKLNIPFLASQLYLSSGYLSLLFKKETSKTINQFITEVRISHARDYLKDHTLSLNRIALLTGYHDANYFSKVFKRETGCTPKSFREGL